MHCFLQTEKVFVTPLEQDEIGPGIWQSGAGRIHSAASAAL